MNGEFEQKPSEALPLTAFLLLGIYGKVIWKMMFAAILGIGHIGMHLEHQRDTLRKAEREWSIRYFL